MLKLATMLNARSKIKRSVMVGGLVMLFGLVLPTVVLAAPPVPSGAEKCATCHKEETEAWENSPHAKASDLEQGIPGATCTDCHGKLFSIGDHAEAASMMDLDIDSSICKDCHATTFAQWEHSTHAQTGVQCIGCHLSHSQEFRLTDEALCGSCHRDHLKSFSHTIHENTDVTCISCHMSTVPVYETTALVSDQIDSELIPAPTHDFAAVSSHKCMECHDAMTLHVEPLPTDIEQVTDGQLRIATDRIAKLTDDLETTQQINKSLQHFLWFGLGLGMWIGAVLGIAVILVIGYVKQARAKK